MAQEMTTRAYTGPSTDLEPAEHQVLEQFEHCFREATEGDIDIGWMNPQTGGLNKFKRFDCGDFDEAAEFACKVNRVPGQSVYFRPAIIKPDAPKFVSDKDFLSSAGVWVDLDDEGAVKNAPSVTSICRPTMAPHKRAQLYWRFAEQSYDADAVRAINKAIAAKLQGDKAERNAANPARA